MNITMPKNKKNKGDKTRKMKAELIWIVSKEIGSEIHTFYKKMTVKGFFRFGNGTYAPH